MITSKKTIKLTTEQMDRVLDRLSDLDNGSFALEIDADEDLVVYAVGYFISHGYREEDTGGYVETTRDARILLHAMLGEDNVLICDEQEQEILDYLMAA